MHATIRRGLDEAQAIGLALAVHVLAAMLIVVGTMSWRPFEQVEPAGLSIEAVIVDTAALRERREEAAAAVRREQERQRRDEEIAAQQAREQVLEAERRREAERERQAELERQRIEARQREAEQERLQQLREMQERERQEELRQQQEQLEELRRQREEIVRQRQLEEERLRQLEAERQQQREAELQQAREEAAAAAAQAERQAAAEAAARAERLGTLRERYKTAIQRVVTNNWLRPPTARPGLSCRLLVSQIPGGDVISATITGGCNADEATRRSVIAAVERAGTLPYRGYEEVFERELEFIFTYEGD